MTYHPTREATATTTKISVSPELFLNVFLFLLYCPCPPVRDGPCLFDYRYFLKQRPAKDTIKKTKMKGFAQKDVRAGECGTELVVGNHLEYRISLSLYQADKTGYSFFSKFLSLCYHFLDTKRIKRK